jgi:hypothetical protein
MSATYESEQAALKAETAKLETELAEERQTAANTERFLLLVRRYTEIDDLSPTILHEFIEKIVVHAPDKSSGKRKQKVEIFYNSIGIVNVPTEDEMVEYLIERKARRKWESGQGVPPLLTSAKARLETLRRPNRPDFVDYYSKKHQISDYLCAKHGLSVVKKIRRRHAAAAPTRLNLLSACLGLSP